jgi:hypothetical protein
MLSLALPLPMIALIIFTGRPLLTVQAIKNPRSMPLQT